MELSVNTYNGLAADRTQNILNGNAWAKIKSFIKNAPGLITKSLNDASMKIEDINNMDEQQVTEGVHKTFEALRKNVQNNIDYLKRNADRSKSMAVACKGFEESLDTLTTLEKDILDSDENIVKKVARIVLSTLVFIGVKLLQGAKKAALIIASVGIRILCIGAGFLIKFVTAAVRTARNLLSTARSQRELRADEVVFDVEGEFIEC